jgi:hypothetical protein
MRAPRSLSGGRTAHERMGRGLWIGLLAITAIVKRALHSAAVRLETGGGEMWHRWQITRTVIFEKARDEDEA